MTLLKKVWRTLSRCYLLRMPVAKSLFLCSAILTMLNPSLDVGVGSSNSSQSLILCVIIHRYYFNCLQQKFYVSIWYLTLIYKKSYLYCCNLSNAGDNLLVFDTILITQLFCLLLESFLFFHSSYHAIIFIPCFSS